MSRTAGVLTPDDFKGEPARMLPRQPARVGWSWTEGISPQKTRGLWASPAFPGAGVYADSTLDRPATASPSLVAPHQPPSVDNDRIGGAYRGSDKSCPR